MTRFTSLYEFEKWHESIQRRYNASSAGRKQSGAESSLSRCDHARGPRLTKAQGVPNSLQGNGLESLSSPEPTLPKKEGE